MSGFTGKVILIVGGATGIGAETARSLATAGATVIIGDNNSDGAERLAAEIREKGGIADAAFVDVADEALVEKLVTETAERYGRLDGLDLNAAELSPEAIEGDTDAVAIDLELWDRILRVNLRGQLLGIRFAVPIMLAQGGGSIVCISSTNAFLGHPSRIAYSVSKIGTIGLIRHVASRWGKQGIRANAVAPGYVHVERRPRNDAEDAPWLLANRSPRLGEPSDIAAMVRLLLSDEGEWINGQVIAVDGGASMH